MSQVEIALSYLRAGLCVLPAILAAKRPALGAWRDLQRRLPSEEEVTRWFAKAEALCLVGGQVSGNLEMLDFDLAGEAFSAWWERARQMDAALVDRLVVEQSPSGGWHVVYRCQAPVCGNLRLAQRRQLVDGPGEVVIAGKAVRPRQDPDGRWYANLTLVETRGEGGLFLCAPSPGYDLAQGDFCNLPVLTEAEREVLLKAAWSLDQAASEPTPLGSEPNPVATSESAEQKPGLAGSPGCGQDRSQGQGQGRPGDDFNQRGDVRAILRRHGWTLAKAGENEHWRRPGKTSGSSATLKDGVFYVFSSSAAPFEPDRAYAPFSVYALLEHGGDFVAAATALRAEGFGGDDPPESGDVDISAIVARSGDEGTIGRPEGALDDPGPIPDHLFHVPGFVARVMDFTLANAPYPNVGLAFCGALALQSYLCGRKVSALGDLRPNLYLLALAGSGTGKDFPRKVNARVLFEIGHIAGLGDKFASGEGIQDSLLRCGAMLFQNDEMDGVLRQINSDRDNRRESIPNILLTLYTSANDVYPVRVKAGQKETTHIDQPHLTLFGTATPEHFYESLSQRMLTNGFFARLIVVDIGKRGAGQQAGSPRHLPEAILATARWWADFQPGRRQANLASLHPEPRVVPIDIAAVELFSELQRTTELEYDAAEERKDEVGRTAWSRTCENAGKLAMLYACSEDHENPKIGAEAVAWAAAFAKHQTRRQLYLASSYMAANEFDGFCKQALRFLARCRDSDSDYPVPDWLLRRRLALNPTLHNSVIEALRRQERIHFVSLPQRTRPRTGWALR